MALAFDAFAEDKANGGAVSFAHTCTGANLVLYVVVQHRGASGVTGATYNSVAMTQIAYNPGPPTNLVSTKVFRLIAPATGAHNVVLSPVGAIPNRVTVTAISFTGADQTTPNGDPVLTAGGAVSTATSSVTSATGELVVEAFAIMEDTAGAATLTEGAGQTQRGTDQEEVAGGSGLLGALTTEPGAASVTSSWTINTTPSFYTHTIFTVHAAGTDSVPPANAGVTAQESATGTAIALHIDMPSDADLTNYEVRRLTSDYPASDRSNGTVVVASTATTPSAPVDFTDTSLTNGTRYYYRVFCKDASGNWNTGTTISEVAATAMTVIGWYTSGGTLKADGETGANPILEWTVDTSDVEAAKPVPFHVAVGSDNPGPNLSPTQDVLDFYSTDADGTFQYFTLGNWVTIPAAGVPWANVLTGTVTCRWYSALNASQNLYGAVRPEQI